MTLIVLTLSCKKNNSDTEFRKEIDRIKRDELPNQKYTMTTFDFDSLNGSKFSSEINRISDHGIKSIKIITEYTKNDSFIGKVENGPLKHTSLLSQKIIIDREGNENLYYLLEDENGLFIYEVKYTDSNLENNLIESDYSKWNKLIDELNKKNK